MKTKFISLKYLISSFDKSKKQIIKIYWSMVYTQIQKATKLFQASSFFGSGFASFRQLKEINCFTSGLLLSSFGPVGFMLLLDG